ncbi:hypothetical protein SPAB_00412 [Salmonella enterica subsp. enterica serovar Paratyphi B str. SPB7]|uniref:Uncharacterized protein n=3 Tax=Salmonella enterica I TaxID=59201 RepID=A0A6C6YY57_SALPB|nr:hypothetical protein SPAB_00412 [Salmonella enterica subsp. enterica serovar Paratyphi B str. SPB7]
MPTILNPAASKRAKMLPITFFATALGLMMEKVRSIAMFTSEICSVVMSGADYKEHPINCLWMQVTFF